MVCVDLDEDAGCARWSYRGGWERVRDVARCSGDGRSAVAAVVSRPKPSGRSFQRWLIDRLSDTGHVRTLGEPGPLAERLGVTVEVLVAARAVHQQRLSAASRVPVLGVKVSEHAHPQIDVFMPKPVFDIWLDYCDSAKIKGSVILRSAIDAYLRDNWEPPYVLNTWRLGGKSYALNEYKTRKQGTRIVEKTLITRGALRALRRRSTLGGASVRAILRGLITELLEGRMALPPPMPYRAMWDDPARYFEASGLYGPEGSDDDP